MDLFYRQAATLQHLRKSLSIAYRILLRCLAVILREGGFCRHQPAQSGGHADCPASADWLTDQHFEASSSPTDRSDVAPFKLFFSKSISHRHTPCFLQALSLPLRLTLLHCLHRKAHGFKPQASPGPILVRVWLNCPRRKQRNKKKEGRNPV